MFWLGTGLSLVVLFSSSLAHSAGRRGARLAWARGKGAESCVGTDGLTEDVKARLGWDPFVLPSEIHIEGVALRAPAGFVAQLAFRNADGKDIGQRRLEGRNSDCRSLGEAVAVAITVAVDPDGSGASPPPALEAPPGAERPEATEAPAPAPARSPGEPRVRVTLGGGVSGGLVPSPGPTSSLRAALILGERVEVGLGASYQPAQRSGSYGFGLASAEARGCFLPLGPRGLVRVCGAALVGAFETYVHSEALVPVDVGVFPWFGIEVGPVLSLGVGGPLRIELATSAVMPVVRRQGFERGATEPVWQQAVVGGRAELSLGVLF
jgi:hypothetical protein